MLFVSVSSTYFLHELLWNHVVNFWIIGEFKKVTKKSYVNGHLPCNFPSLSNTHLRGLLSPLWGAWQTRTCCDQIDNTFQTTRVTLVEKGEHVKGEFQPQGWAPLAPCGSVEPGGNSRGTGLHDSSAVNQLQEECGEENREIWALKWLHLPFLECPDFASAQTFSSQFALSLSHSSKTLALPILYSDNSTSEIQPFALQMVFPVFL